MLIRVFLMTVMFCCLCVFSYGQTPNENHPDTIGGKNSINVPEDKNKEDLLFIAKRDIIYDNDRYGLCLKHPNGEKEFIVITNYKDDINFDFLTVEVSGRKCKVVDYNGGKTYVKNKK